MKQKTCKEILADYADSLRRNEGVIQASRRRNGRLIIALEDLMERDDPIEALSIFKELWIGRDLGRYRKLEAKWVPDSSQEIRTAYPGGKIGQGTADRAKELRMSVGEEGEEKS